MDGWMDGKYYMYGTLTNSYTSNTINDSSQSMEQKRVRYINNHHHASKMRSV